jgi:predicted small secreted protein
MGNAKERAAVVIAGANRWWTTSNTRQLPEKRCSCKQQEISSGVYPLNEQGEDMKNSMMRTLLMLLLAFFITAFTAGCNTVEDIEDAGDEIEEATD